MGFLVHQHQHSHKHKLIIEQANCGLAALHSVLLHRVEDTENVQEEVDNIQVEVNGGQDVLLRRELLHQHAGVIDDEATEDQGPSSSQEQTCIITVEEEPHEGSNDEDPQTGEKPSSHFAEISFGLKGVGC